jgi:phosphatidylglycerophosphatase A
MQTEEELVRTYGQIITNAEGLECSTTSCPDSWLTYKILFAELVLLALLVFGILCSWKFNKKYIQELYSMDSKEISVSKGKLTMVN